MYQIKIAGFFMCLTELSKCKFLEKQLPKKPCSLTWFFSWDLCLQVYQFI